MLRDFTYIEDIVNAARLAVSYLEDKTLPDFLNDVQCQDAVIRRIEIIGEAVRRISNDIQEIYFYIPWEKMRGMRNRLIHDYDEVDLNEVWNTVKVDLPKLLPDLEQILCDDDS